jgi:hypothetical protein
MIESTHDVVLGGTRVVKRYRSWSRGEPDREWAGLSLIQRFAPGIAPQPLERRTEGGVPAIVMTRVPGRPFGQAGLCRDELHGLADALRGLYSAVPTEHLAGVPERRMGPGEMVPVLRSWVREAPRPVGSRVRSALASAEQWLDGPEASTLMGPLGTEFSVWAMGTSVTSSGTVRGATSSTSRTRG